MPNQPKTPARAIRIDDATWDRVKTVAQERGETATDVVRRALHEHLGIKVSPLPKPPTIAAITVTDSDGNRYEIEVPHE